MNAFHNMLSDRGYQNISNFECDRYLATKNGEPVFIKIQEDDDDNNEIRVLSALVDVQHVTKLVESFIYNDSTVIVTKFVDGNTLDKLLEGIIPESDKTHIAHQLIEIVNNIHKHDYIHGDLHTNNIVVDTQLKVTVIDFGTASKINENAYHPLYPPPEALVLKDNMYIIDPKYRINLKYDYWALGLVLSRIFTNDPIPSASNFMLDECSADDVLKCYTEYIFQSSLSLEDNTIISNLLKHDPVFRII